MESFNNIFGGTHSSYYPNVFSYGNTVELGYKVPERNIKNPNDYLSTDSSVNFQYCLIED